MLELNFNPFPVIASERLLLRKITKKDSQHLFLLRSNVQAMQFIDKPSAASIDEIKLFIKQIDKKLKKNDAIVWAISLKSNLQLIGTISYHRIEHENYRAVLGYMLMPEHWNKGYISEVMPKILDYGFDSMKLHSIEATINPNNSVSRRLLEKFKFKKEGYFKENYFFDGNFLDTEVFSLVKPV